MKHVILIPAYNPNYRLIQLVTDLMKLKLPIIIINDGSEKEAEEIFDCIEQQYPVEVITHEKNKGKGAAIKTGIQYIMNNYYPCSGIIMADADGQHAPKDIQNISASLTKHPNAVVLGVRDFNKNQIPLKSKLGNKLTSFVFYLSTRKKCQDTQTGLRGISRPLFERCLAISGDRYEYEMNMLMQLAKDEVQFVYEEIETIYIDGNKSSHFNPIIDSIKIYLNILKFSLSSLMSSALDLVIFTMMIHFLDFNGTYKILIPTIFARVVSATFNFVMNKVWVFSSNSQTVKQGSNYFLLSVMIMIGSYLGVTLLSFLPLSITWVKILVDGTLFLLSYQVQKIFIFNSRRADIK